MNSEKAKYQTSLVIPSSHTEWQENNIRMAFQEDHQLLQLYAQKEKIYLYATPTVILKDGKAEILWIDETNHPRLPKINEMIERRIDQIKEIYS